MDDPNGSLTSNSESAMIELACQFRKIDRALDVIRHLLNIVSDGEGLNSNPRISALATATQRYLDDADEAMLAASQILGFARPLSRDLVVD